MVTYHTPADTLKAVNESQRWRVLVVFGTRPEAIKMAPVLHRLRESSSFEVRACVTGQHRQLLDQVLSSFEICPDFDLNLMTQNQNLAGLTASVVTGMTAVYRDWRPDVVIVHGDTSTTFAASLAAFYEKIPIAHVEAGLRTYNKCSPWPEEVHRCLMSVLATWHLAPTERAQRNLLAEGVEAEKIAITGNTVIDALRHTMLQLHTKWNLWQACADQFSFLDPGRRLVLVTGHRRENFGEGLEHVCEALRRLAERSDIEIIYPVHLNPSVCLPVRQMLGSTKNVRLIAPLGYTSFVYLLERCYFILTDSGGIQEEAAFLGKPVLIMRNKTERSEALESGGGRLVGTDADAIVAAANHLLEDEMTYERSARSTTLFGDGHASQRIVHFLEAHLSPGTCPAAWDNRENHSFEPMG